MVCPQPRSTTSVGLVPALCPTTALTMEPPSVQSPFAQFRCYRCWGIVYRLLGGRCSSVFAPTDSCANPSDSPLLQLLLRSRSLCRLLPAPAASGIFPTLSLRILPRMPGPLPRRVPQSAHTCFFLRVIGLPQQGCGSASPLLPANTIFRGAYFRGCRHFFMFKPPSLLTSQIVPNPAHTAAGQLRFLRPSRTCFVTSACIGYACRLNTGN